MSNLSQGGLVANPIVSVIIPAYRVTPYIAETVNSALSQTRQDHEVLVINDGCPDTENMEAALAPLAGRIRYIRQPNGGPSAARNRGLAEARGKYIALLDGDDLYLPNYMESQLACMERDETIDLLYPNGWMFEEGKPGQVASRGPLEAEGPVDLKALVTATKVVTNIAMIRREVVIRAGGWDNAIRHSEDLDLYMRIAASGARIVFNPAQLARYRIRPGSQMESTESMCSGQIYAFDKALRDLKLDREMQEVLGRHRELAIANRHFFAGKAAFAAGDPARAKQEFEASNRILGNRKVALVLLGLRFAPWLAFAAGSLWQKWLKLKSARGPIPTPY